MECISELIKTHQTLIASFVGATVVAVYYISKAALDKTVFKRELFESCNRRYDTINDRLEQLIHLEHKTEVDSIMGQSMSLDDYWQLLFEDEPTKRPDAITSAQDYINLCSEEYYWFKKGYVDKDVWKCWHNGMLSWHTDSFFLQKIVAREKTKNAAYYNEDFLDLFP